MRRLGIEFARAGMVLATPVFDSGGWIIVEAGTNLDEDSLRLLAIHGAEEVLIDDPRVADVPAANLIRPELMGAATRALRTLLEESRPLRRLHPDLLGELEQPVYAMVRELFPDMIGEPVMTGCRRFEDWPAVRPVRAAGLALLLGRRLGLGMIDLAQLCVAAILMDAGCLLAPLACKEGRDPADPLPRDLPRHSADLLQESGRFSLDTVQAVLHHHERWDGAGYPDGLRGTDIPLGARILGISDAYYSLVSARPGCQALKPHEAIEYLMAFSGDAFDPDLVHLFARQVPLYPAGVSVLLDTGELAIVCDPNVGHIGRPLVRVVSDAQRRSLKEGHDVDLSLPNHQNRMITHVVGY